MDTAESYGAGLSERLVGRCLVARPKRVVLATKGWSGGPPSAAAAVAAARASCERLGVERVGLYQVHTPAADVEAQAYVFSNSELDSVRADFS